MAQSQTIPPALKWGGIIALVYFGGRALMKSQQKHQAQIFRNLQMKITGVRPEESGMLMSVEISNPNNDRFEVKSFVGNMLINGKQAGTVNAFGDYVIQPNSKMEVPLHIKPLLYVLLHLREMFGKKKMQITFAGTMNVNDKPIPLTLSYTA